MLRVIRLIRTSAVVASLCCLGASAIAQDTPSGLSELQGQFSALPQGATLRVIVKLKVDPASVSTLGRPNALRAASALAAQAMLQLGISAPTGILGTDFLVMRVTSDQLNNLATLNVVDAYFVDNLNLPSLPTLGPAIGANSAHNNGATGIGTVVAIIDTGVDTQHPFLTSRIAAEACFSTNDPGAQIVSLCQGGASFRDGSGSAIPCVSIPGCEHGTHVAGIAASGDSSKTGLAPAAGIIAIKVFSQVNSSAICSPYSAPCLRAYDSDVLSALGYLRDSLSQQFPISSINMSLGGGNNTQPCPSDVRAGVIQQLRDIGIATVIASGNNGYTNAISSPACIGAAISVGSVNNSSLPNEVSSFSNSSSFLTILAPGNPVLSSLPGQPEGQIGSLSGTSMAAPVVSGAIAALRSKFYVDVQTVEAALTGSGVSVKDLRNGITKPRISLLNAFNSLQALAPTNSRIWMKRTWSDTGLANDHALVGSILSSAPFVWIRNSSDAPAFPNRYHHQNPIYGQPNYVDIAVVNTGKTQGSGTLSLFVSHASPNPSDASAWIRLIDKDLTIAPQTQLIYQFPWTTVPAPGHYCLLVKWTDEGGDKTLNFNDITAAILNSPGNLIWHNINVVGPSGSSGTQVSLEWRKSALSSDQNFVVEIAGFRKSTGGEVVVQLPRSVVELLKAEPTLRDVKIEYEGAYVLIRMLLSDGVYYFPLPQNLPDKFDVPINIRRKSDERFALGSRINVLQVRDIAQHKSRGDGVIGAVTYQIE